MNETPLTKLIELVLFDQDLVRLAREIERVHGELEHDNHEIKLCEVAIEHVQKSLHEAKKEVDAKELEMRSLDELEKEKRKKLDGMTRAREYDSLTKEIDQLKKQQNDLETALLDAWKKYEHLKQELKSKHEQCDTKVKALNTVIADKMKQLEELKNELMRKQEERKSKLTDIPQELLERYDALYKRVANPIVPLIDGSCSACFYAVTQQDLAELKRGKLIQCKDCFRLLYHPDVHQKE